MEQSPEPWLRGPLADVHPLIMPVFFSFGQVREDLGSHVTGLSKPQVWQLFGKSSVGFHLKHMAGSVDRLSTYLLGQHLSEEQLRFLRSEHDSNEDLNGLLASVHASLGVAEQRLRRIDPASLYEVRSVGRQALPTTVIGLLLHLAEHTQRHLGQTLTLAQVLRQTS